MKALDLTKRINRARRLGEDVSVLERELERLESTSAERRKKRALQESSLERQRIGLAKARAEVIAHKEERLRSVMLDALDNGYSLGWVINEYKRREGSLPGPVIWRRVVAQYREQIVDAQVEKSAMKVRVMQS